MEFGLCPWANRGRAHFHFQWDLQGLCYNSGTVTKPFISCSVVVVFKMLVKREAQESLEFGLKIHSIVDVLVGFWRRVAKAL